MSVHTKGHHIKEERSFIYVRVEMPRGKEIFYYVPCSAKQKLSSFLKGLDVSKNEITPWEQATPWEVLAKDRIEKYKKSGLVLRGARYREGLSQVELAKMSGVHQNEISKIENGKRCIGEKVAKRLAKSLKINYLLLLENSASNSV